MKRAVQIALALIFALHVPTTKAQSAAPRHNRNHCHGGQRQAHSPRQRFHCERGRRDRDELPRQDRQRCRRQVL
jgi:hypothetical protein